METVQTNQPVKKEFEFELQLSWLSEDKGVLFSNEVKGLLPVATPPEFGGSGSDWSPEHLLLGAVSSCFMSTYLSFAKKFRFEITRLSCHATGTVGMVDGKLCFTNITLHPKIFVDNFDFLSKARVALEKTEKYCLVTNSLSARVVCKGDVRQEHCHTYESQ